MFMFLFCSIFHVFLFPTSIFYSHVIFFSILFCFFFFFIIMFCSLLLCCSFRFLLYCSAFYSYVVFSSISYSFVLHISPFQLADIFHSSTYFSHEVCVDWYVWPGYHDNQCSETMVSHWYWYQAVTVVPTAFGTVRNNSNSIGITVIVMTVWK